VLVVDKSTEHDKPYFDFTFLCFLRQYQRQRKCFLSERELKKASRDTLTRAAWLGPTNFWSVRSEHAHAHARYPGLFFRTPGFSPYMGREERRVQGLDYEPRSPKTSIDQFRHIKIQPKTIDLSSNLWGITTEFVGFIPQSLVLRSIVLGWILIYWNWSISLAFDSSLVPSGFPETRLIIQISEIATGNWKTFSG